MNQVQTFCAIKFRTHDSPVSSSMWLKWRAQTQQHICRYYNWPHWAWAVCFNLPTSPTQRTGEPLDCQFAANSGILGGGGWVLPYWNRKSQL